jgi:hypothetical protein
LAFHDWISSALGVTPLKLGDEIDYLFRRATEDLATVALRRRDAIVRIAERQREPYADRQFPEPGEDRELLLLLSEALRPYLARRPPPDVWRALIQRLRQHMTHENKRKNLVGEGFEDVLASVIGRVSQKEESDRTTCGAGSMRCPAFIRCREEASGRRWIWPVVHQDRGRTLITAKWSIRADREEQFKTDYDDYIRAEAFNRQFDYVLVTNEFDPARLKRRLRAPGAERADVHACRSHQHGRPAGRIWRRARAVGSQRSRAHSTRQIDQPLAVVGTARLRVLSPARL